MTHLSPGGGGTLAPPMRNSTGQPCLHALHPAHRRLDRDGLRAGIARRLRESRPAGRVPRRAHR